MIKCCNVIKSVGNVEILSGVSFDAKKDSILGILGPNGAGKSTTLKIIATLLKPTSGQVLVSDYDVLKDQDTVRSLISYLPESLPLYPELTVKEYLTIFGELKNSKNLSEELELNLNRCRLTQVANKRCSVLSKGFRQKVGLAAALMGSPKILLLDEPTSGLDPREIVEIRALIKSLKGSHTVLFSSHILSEVSEVCDEVVMFVGGKTTLQESIKDLQSKGGLEKAFLRTLEGAS